MAEPKAKSSKRFWRGARRAFRWCRIFVWLAILALLIFVIWLNRVGLPGWAKDHLVSALRAHGMELEFTRMRLVWYRGIVAENIHFGKSGQPRGPRASATEAELHLRVKPLLHGEFDLEGVVLRGGHFVMPVWGTNDEPRDVNIEKVNGELRFLPNDRWQLSALRAQTFGVDVTLNGTITNASHVQKWKFGSEKPKAETPQAFWHDIVSDFQRTRFTAPTEIIGSVLGDARDLGTFRAKVDIRSPGIDSPWGKGTNFRLSAEVVPQPGVLLHANVNLDAEEAETPWGQAASVHLESQFVPSLTQWTPTNAHVNLQVKRARTPWANAASLVIRADFRPTPSDVTSSFAEYSVRGQQIQTKWARFAQAELTSSGVVSSSNAWPRSTTTKLKFAGGEIPLGRASSGSIEAKLNLPPYEMLQLTNDNISWWSRLDLVAAELHGQLADVHSPRFDAKLLSLKSAWQAPQLTVQELDISMYGGVLRAAANLDASTRVLSAEIKSSVDPHFATNLLSTNALHFLSEFHWQVPPTASARALVTLPVWTNNAGWKNAKWAAEVLPTASLIGNFNVGPMSFRSVAVDSAQSDVNYSNGTWRLPNLLFTRPEGRAYIGHVSNERTGDFQFVIDSTLNPLVFAPLLDRSVQDVLKDFQFNLPPHVRAELAGNWLKPKEISASGKVAITNAVFKEQPIISCRATVLVTNLIISVLDPVVQRSEGTGRADSVVIDIPKMRLFIDNATGMLDPAAITHVINPGVEETMRPYQFLNAPQARAWGMVDFVNGLGSDLWFEVAGGAFEWHQWRFQQVTGIVHWGGPFLTISNFVGSMHGGQMEGSLHIDFTAKKGADFAFRTLVHDINLHSLMVDMGNPTNKLEGNLGGLLVITNANTESFETWFGYGNMTLQDGLIWEVPVFGFFSPMLNLIIPGAGNNRAKEATATFNITNGVFYSSDLRIHASGMRLKYEGTVDFDTRINGRMEAQLFRDTPGIGLLVSKVFWAVTKVFEYKITGTFGKPKPEPVFIPKLLLAPFHPLRTLRELVDPDNEGDLPK
jgi:hypothetical protein